MSKGGPLVSVASTYVTLVQLAEACGCVATTMNTILFCLLLGLWLGWTRSDGGGYKEFQT